MKANKYSITINVQVLSNDSAAYLIEKAKEFIDNECPDGHLQMDDGYKVSWHTEITKVNF